MSGPEMIGVMIGFCLGIDGLFRLFFDKLGLERKRDVAGVVCGIREGPERLRLGYVFDNENAFSLDSEREVLVDSE